MKARQSCLIFLIPLAAGCTPGKSNLPNVASVSTHISPAEETPTAMSATADPNQPAFDMNARIGRGVNLGNALEAPKEGEWGVTLEPDYFRLISEQGFDSVRVPIRWSAHALTDTPFTIDPVFFDRIDWVVEQAVANDLVVILNIHHYEEIFSDPPGQRERFLALWEQIAGHYQDTPETVVFELLNEPNGDQLTAPVWNELAAEALAVVRRGNPQRFVIIGPVNWNNVDALSSLELPADDRRIIATFHYYNPFQFTHQGAEWTAGSDSWLGTTWEATETQRAAVQRDLEKAAQWSRENQRPVYLGEFGAYHKADMQSRARWTEFVARTAEAGGMSWAYWEFCAGFGIYDPTLQMYIKRLVDALIPPQ
jgi:endoglucanase